MRTLCTTLLILICLTCFGQQGQATIKKLMEDQEASWNRGDIRAFMEPYWHSDSLRFIGSKGITYGWQNTLDNYLKSYNTPEKMGKLHFTILHTDAFGTGVVHVTGKWQLEREKPVGGYFTLVWKKIKGQWVIISDHTS